MDNHEKNSLFAVWVSPFTSYNKPQGAETIYKRKKQRYQNHINIAIQHVFPLFSQIQNINFIIVKIVKKVDFQKVKG
ncbi:hypothetical protein P9D77_15415 [Bacillus rugosus]|uniref:hypothetical protein n=1 Tax=Bacillus rugosus TaxID=2715209 RepID=UPI002DB824E1|nr:hypothetical protein [Bacillus rugosus]MEC1549700.1 hypothetical protein [Bacillus rugosus]